VEAEQRVALHIVQLTGVWVRELGRRLGQVGGGVEAQQVVQPRLHGVADSISELVGWLVVSLRVGVGRGGQVVKQPAETHPGRPVANFI
jgi:hypothetical protein